ncbi:amino acid adenylation domain-containing protein [Streptomyces niveus]|uniref:amino acid adenylation domain-containing protein n=1 Tax=Streptomyces niveus TaxID=193462 RepID=UPI0036AD6E71
MTIAFTLPPAWRPGPAATAPLPCEALVPYGDLAERLGALADCCGAALSDVLLAAHLKVIGTLTEDLAVHTDVVTPGSGGRPRTVPVKRATTWRILVSGTAKRTAPVEGAPAAAEETVGDPSPRADQVLFTAWAGPEQDTGAPSGPYGLHTVADASGALRLRTAGEALRADRLASVTRMYRLVLESMADGPDGSALAAYLDPDERHAVLQEWSDGGTADRGMLGVDALFRAQAARTPDAPAVRLDGGAVSYQELDERSNRIAHHLVGLGARPESLVGVCLRRTADLLPTLLGVWKSGAGYLPLDPDLPTERLRLMTEAAGCRLVVTETGHVPALSAPEGVRYVLLDEERQEIARHPATAPEIILDPTRIAYLIYTSGSTGAPKGVMVEHRGLANYLLWTADAYAARGTGGSAVFSSISFDLGIPSLFTPLLTGQAVHLLPEPFVTADLGEQLAEGAPYSFLKMTPGQLDLLSLDLTPEEAHGLAGIVIAAGDAFTSDLAERWIKCAGPGGTAVGTEYGPTEITIGNSGQPVDEPPGSELIPLGTPIPNTTMYVLTEQLEPVPVGVPGEVYIGGAGVARGYLDRPALTAERFLPDPYGAPGSRLYRTGDRARWQPNGVLEFLGRTDHQVKIRGYRVETGEIQAGLRRHPDIAEVVVIACGSVRNRTLAAFVVAAPGRTADAGGLRVHLAVDLPGYMIPTHFLTIEQIPLTTNGKVDTRALQSLLPR